MVFSCVFINFIFRRQIQKELSFLVSPHTWPFFAVDVELLSGNVPFQSSFEHVLVWWAPDSQRMCRQDYLKISLYLFFHQKLKKKFFIEKYSHMWVFFFSFPLVSSRAPPRLPLITFHSNCCLLRQTVLLLPPCTCARKNIQSNPNTPTASRPRRVSDIYLW